MPTPTVIQVTQLNGNSLLLNTQDLVYATDNGNGSTIIQENIQTNPQPIYVQETLNQIIALDDAFLTVNVISPFVGTAVLSGFRCKSVNELTDFRRISYEGVGLVNKQFDVTDTLAAIASAINTATSGSSLGAFQLVASIENFDMAGAPGNYSIPYEAGQDGTNILQYFVRAQKYDGTPYAGDNNETTYVKFNGAILMTIDASVSGWVFNVSGATNAPTGNPSLGITVEEFILEILNPMTGGAFPINVEVWAAKSA